MGLLFFSQQIQGTELNGLCPVSHFWDESEHRVLVCETVPVGSESSSSDYLDMVNTAPNSKIEDLLR